MPTATSIKMKDQRERLRLLEGGAKVR